jgi:hypothetical protein
MMNDEKARGFPRFSSFIIHHLYGFRLAYRLRRSRRALRFLLPILRRRRGLAMRRLLSLSVSKGAYMPGLMVFLVTKGRSVTPDGRFV